MKLPRLSQTFAIADTASGVAIKVFSRLWDQICSAIEALSDELKPAFSAYANVSQPVTSSVLTKVTLGTVNFDTNANFASSRFTATRAGYYQIDGALRPTDTVAVTVFLLSIFKNGLEYRRVTDTATISDVIFLDVGEYVELYGFIAGTSPSFDFASAAVTSAMSGCFLRAA